MADQTQISIPSGLAALTTYGSIRMETYKALSDLRSFSERNGLQNVQWEFYPGALVDKARNDACRAALKQGHGWILFIDGDMTFPADALVQPVVNGRPGMLQVAFGLMPHIDVLGGLCPLRGEFALGTVDSGTGTWEGAWYPGSGIVEVMRTGGAFLLIKRKVLEGLSDPWFRMRVPMRPIDALAELDNFFRMKFDGRNPLRDTPERYWERAEEIAKQDPSVVAEQFVPVEVGEDSGFCDRARNAGFRLFVDTDITCGHVDTVVRTWVDHKKGMESMEQQHRHAVGLLT